MLQLGRRALNAPSRLRRPGWRRAAIVAAAAVAVAIVAIVLLTRHRPARVRNAFDLDANDWQAPPVSFAPCEFTFRPDQVRRPTAAQIARWRDSYPLVRPIPYPYFAGISIPTDCCSSYLSDLYYFGTLLSRRFGLDCPSSFWVFNCQPNPVASLYLGDYRTPAHGFVDLAGDAVDRLPLLLTSYYRGWLDHIHQWSGESGTFTSLVTPHTLTLGPSGDATVALGIGERFTHVFLGFELALDVDARIRSVELEIQDANSQSHFIVYGRGLDGRPGWDLSALTRAELRHHYLHLDQEANPTDASCLGQAGKPHVQSVKLTARGEPGAAVTVQLLRPFDMTRAMIVQQIKAMRELNLLPICSTNHGGNSSWTQVDGWNLAGDVIDPVSKHRFHLERPPLGAMPGSPSYCADLLDAFGIHFHNQTSRRLPGDPEGLTLAADLLRVWTRADGRKMYVSPRWGFAPTAAHPDMTTNHFDQFENLGGNVVRYLARYDEFGQHRVIYTHHNFYNREAFAPPGDAPRSLSDVRRLQPYLEQTLRALACMKYNLDGQRAYYQRVWCCSLSVALRFAQAQRGLAQHARLDGDDIYINPWQDEVSGQSFPEGLHLTQDLHGQTFYVADARRTRVYCGGVEITSLRRNPPDFTGRPSVTVVDTETPTLIFDEVPLNLAGAVIVENGRLSYPEADAARGQRCLELCSAAGGTAAMVWTPRRLDNHETDFVHLCYRKTNPAAVVTFSWRDAAGQEYVVTEGPLGDRLGWEIGPHTGSGYREVVLEYADMHGPANRDRRLPRGAIKQVRFALEDAGPGDAVFFDRVEFLAARGVRVEAGDGVVLGGRLSSRADGVVVEARAGARTWHALTEHGGWYLLRGVPRDTVVEITATVDGHRYRPERGRQVQAVRNDLEYHIQVPDRRRGGPG